MHSLEMLEFDHVNEDLVSIFMMQETSATFRNVLKLRFGNIRDSKEQLKKREYAFPPNCFSITFVDVPPATTKRILQMEASTGSSLISSVSVSNVTEGEFDLSLIRKNWTRLYLQDIDDFKGWRSSWRIPTKEGLKDFAFTTTSTHGSLSLPGKTLWAFLTSYILSLRRLTFILVDHRL
ncbi:hypothetical protein T439DRAFT_325246, partial [Meredithblackwellia eburnea MCA 4105]